MRCPSASSVLDAFPLTAQNVNVISTAGTHSADPLSSILIVDDDESVVDTFSRLLKLEGFTVATALDPAVGLKLAESLAPAAIILDMRMPLISGIQFLRQVRSRSQLVNIPVAIVTGDCFLSDELEHELRALGATLRYKPMWAEDLVALARTLVSR
jgi:two-component system, OmpR family, response regulator PrrA